jgi:hypothetical protein
MQVRVATIVFITRDGVELLFSEKDGYLSTDPSAIITALEEDMKSSNKRDAAMATNLYIRTLNFGGIKFLNR